MVEAIQQGKAVELQQLLERHLTNFITDVVANI
jgi:hypothetical protein